MIQSAPAQEQQTYTLDDLARAWRAKHERIRSGRFRWTESRWVAKGTASAPLPGQPRGEPVPPQHTTYTYRNSLVFDGESMRYESDRPEPHIRERKMTPHKHVGAWNGSVGKVLRHHRNFPTGEIRAFAADLAQTPLFAFRVGFRMLHPQWYSLDLKDYVISNRRDVIEGFPCVIIETSPAILGDKAARGRRPLKSSYWISPQQDFAVVRFTSTLNELTLTQLNVFYEHAVPDGWYPSGWRFVDGSKDPPMEIVEATVIEHALNVAVDPAEFEFEFPKGTWVRDTRSNEEYIADGEGGKRPIRQKERRRAAHEDLLRSDAGVEPLHLDARVSPEFGDLAFTAPPSASPAATRRWASLPAAAGRQP